MPVVRMLPQYLSLRTVALALVATTAAFVMVAVTGVASAAQGPWILPANIESNADKTSYDTAAAAGEDGTSVMAWTRTVEWNTMVVEAKVKQPDGSFSGAEMLSSPDSKILWLDADVGLDGSVAVVWTYWHNPSFSDVVQGSFKPAGGSR